MRYFAILLALLLICSIAGARYPEIGDYVRISQDIDSQITIFYEGNITDISDSLICLNSSSILLSAGKNGRKADLDYPVDICIGTGQVSVLKWISA